MGIGLWKNKIVVGIWDLLLTQFMVLVIRAEKGSTLKAHCQYDC